MNQNLRNYESRLRQRDIRTFDPATLDSLLNPEGPKFHPDGTVKPFFGFTCIAWVDQESALYQTLCDVQAAFRTRFDEIGAGGVFSFLNPASFHMTICDIEASPTSLIHNLDERIQQVETAFKHIGAAGKVSAQIRGIGLTSTITALVRFDEAAQLLNVFAMEQKIKDATGVDERPFTGHITLAYTAQHPGEHSAAIKEILLPYDKDLGEFTFSKFDLTYFPHMNEFTPLLTLNLDDGHIMRHDENISALKTAPEG